MENQNRNAAAAQATSDKGAGTSRLWLLLALIAAAAAWYINFGNRSITGTWACTSPLPDDGVPFMEVSFEESGDASWIMDGETAVFTYFYADDALSLYSDSGTATFPCKVEGNTMIWTWTEDDTSITLAFTRQ